jgi:hypothetical protein
MHVTTKEVDDQGVHVLSSTVEADGPFELVSPKGKLEAEIIALRRTDSGGVYIQTALKITEPTPEVPKAPEPVKAAPTPEELAGEYLKSKGLSPKEAQAAIERFGAAKILAKKNQELQEELDALVAPKKS